MEPQPALQSFAATARAAGVTATASIAAEHAPNLGHGKNCGKMERCFMMFYPCLVSAIEYGGFLKMGDPQNHRFQS